MLGVFAKTFHVATRMEDVARPRPLPTDHFPPSWVKQDDPFARRTERPDQKKA